MREVRYLPVALLLVAACGDDSPVGAGGGAADATSTGVDSTATSSGSAPAGTGAGGGAVGTSGATTATSSSGGASSAGGGEQGGGEPSAVATVRIEDEAGRPQADIRIFAATADGERVGETTTDADGEASIEVPDGGSIVTFRSRFVGEAQISEMELIEEVPPEAYIRIVTPNDEFVEFEQPMTLHLTIEGEPGAVSLLTALPCIPASAGTARTRDIPVRRCVGHDSIALAVVATTALDGVASWGEARDIAFVAGGEADVTIALDQTSTRTITLDPILPEGHLGDVEVSLWDPYWFSSGLPLIGGEQTLEVPDFDGAWDLALRADVDLDVGEVANLLRASAPLPSDVVAWDLTRARTIDIDPPDLTGAGGPTYSWSNAGALGPIATGIVHDFETDVGAVRLRVVAPATATSARLPDLPADILAALANPDENQQSMAVYAYAQDVGATYAEHLASGATEAAHVGKTPSAAYVEVGERTSGPQ